MEGKVVPHVSPLRSLMPLQYRFDYKSGEGSPHGADLGFAFGTSMLATDIEDSAMSEGQTIAATAVTTLSTLTLTILTTLTLTLTLVLRSA